MTILAVQSDIRKSVDSESFDSDSDCIVTVKVVTVLLQVIKGESTMLKFRLQALANQPFLI